MRWLIVVEALLDPALGHAQRLLDLSVARLSGVLEPLSDLIKLLMIVGARGGTGIHHHGCTRR
eukprot:10035998-Alexandrium_andersonii.AAC.1